MANAEALQDILAAHNLRGTRLIMADCMAGHFPFRENPEQFVYNVTSFTSKSGRVIRIQIIRG